MKTLRKLIVTHPRYIQRNGIEVAVGAAIATGIGALASSTIGAASTSKQVADTNQQNKDIAEQTNALNYQIMQEQNSFNAEQAELNRQFQSQEAEKMRQYNSLSAQLERAEAAGVNPASIIGNGSTAVTSMPSGSAASGSGLPQMQAPTMQNNANALAQLINGLNTATGNAASNIADAKLKESQADKNKAETDAQMTFNKFAERMHEMKLNLDESTMHRNYADINQINTNIDVLREQIDEVKQKVSLMSEQERSLAIENLYKDKKLEAEIQGIIARYNLDDATAKVMLTRLPFEVMGLQANAAAAYASADYQHALSSLTEKQQQELDITMSILRTEDKKARWDLMLDYFYSKDERKERLSAQKFENSTLSRSIRAGKDVAIGIGAAAAAWKMADSPSKKAAYQVKDKMNKRPIYDPATGSYSYPE